MEIMDSMNIIFSYPIGTYMSKEENGILHIDQIAEYIITKNNSYVVLNLDALKDSRRSKRITLDEFITSWKKYETNKKKVKQKKALIN